MSNKTIQVFFFSCSALFVLAQLACTSNATKTVLPNTPESVARQWQDYLDENKFVEAKTLSAPTAIEWLDWVSETLTDEMLKEDTLPPGKILQMACVENGDLASCAYTFDDNGFVYEDTFKLLKMDGQWLIDIPVENMLESDGIENLIQQLQEEMEAAKATESE